MRTSIIFARLSGLCLVAAASTSTIVETKTSTIISCDSGVTDCSGQKSTTAAAPQYGTSAAVATSSIYTASDKTVASSGYQFPSPAASSSKASVSTSAPVVSSVAATTPATSAVIESSKPAASPSVASSAQAPVSSAAYPSSNHTAPATTPASTSTPVVSVNSNSGTNATSKASVVPSGPGSAPTSMVIVTGTAPHTNATVSSIVVVTPTAPSAPASTAITQPTGSGASAHMVVPGIMLGLLAMGACILG